MKKYVIALLTILISLNSSSAMNVGFNQAWFKTAYGGQYLNHRYDEQEVRRIFSLVKEAGSQTLRLWFFESNKLPMIEKSSSGEILHLRPEYIQNVIKMLKVAKEYDVKVYMTLFDAHAYFPIKYSKEELSLLKYIFTEEGSSEFLDKILKPLFNEIEKNQLSEQIGKIDLINEGDTIVKRFGFKKQWRGLERFICQWTSSIHQIDGFEKTPITYSIRLHPLVLLPFNLLKDNGPLRCTDFIDFHSYNNDGDIYRCSMVRRYVEKNKKAVILGEFGQAYFNHRYDDELQVKNTKNYIQNAMECGFSEALAWRLSDIRNGYNPEARYSFEAFGQMRPAYQIIQEHNLKK